MTMDVRAIYEGSDGEATRALYERLGGLGVAGVVAVNLFRAQKCSARAKVYRGAPSPGSRSFKRLAYDRKNWSIDNLTKVLAEHDTALGIRWGWQMDEATIGYPWVLYVEIPTGQVSYHSDRRRTGPDFDGQWDGRRNISHVRIIAWCEQLLTQKPAPCENAQAVAGE